MDQQIFVSTGDKLTLSAVEEDGTPISITLKVTVTSPKMDDLAGSLDSGIRLNFMEARRFGSNRTDVQSQDSNCLETSPGEDNTKPSSQLFGKGSPTVVW